MTIYLIKQQLPTAGFISNSLLCINVFSLRGSFFPILRNMIFDWPQSLVFSTLFFSLRRQGKRSPRGQGSLRAPRGEELVQQRLTIIQRTTGSISSSNPSSPFDRSIGTRVGKSAGAGGGQKITTSSSAKLVINCALPIRLLARFPLGSLRVRDTIIPLPTHENNNCTNDQWLSILHVHVLPLLLLVGSFEGRRGSTT